jgi:DNA invertase Pin-like site-specific DNA recombinase
MPRKKSHKSRMYQPVGEPAPGARVVGYVRYSSDMQRATTIVTQKRSILPSGEAHGWVHVGWYEEPEHSAKYEEIEQRPVFAQLLADAGVKFDAVLCYNTGRWSRNVAVTHRSLSMLRQKGVWWETTDESWNIDRIQEPGHSLSFGFTAQMDNDYVVQLSKRTIAGKEDRARDGYHNGQVPFGYLSPDYPLRPSGAPSTWSPPRMPVRVDPETFPALVKIGELAAQGWSDPAIATELAGYISFTARFGNRALSKDTIAAIRRLWFPREFAPGAGVGTIETPSGELVPGKHPAAWRYDLWQRMVEAKAGQYRRPRRESRKQAHEFSRIIVCASCHRPLRVQNYPTAIYYRDTSAIRKLECATGGNRLVNSALVVSQFGELLASLALPSEWREAIAQRCQATHGQSGDTERAQARRQALEAEQKRVVLAFTKGVLPESDLDTIVQRIRAELQTLPAPETRNTASRIAAAISAGETLADMASYWNEAEPEERRDMVWSLLTLDGLIYDLERRVIAAILPRPDVLPVLALGLGEAWETRDSGLWRRAVEQLPIRPATGARKPPPTPFALTPEQQVEARQLIASGQSLRQVGRHFGVSYGAIWRLLRMEASGDAAHDD